ncbi:MAG: restriction endonuclease subunit S [Coleofasciculus sp. E2-BRE-01]
MSNYKLPEGYKQTKIGLIPEDWKVEKFQDITEVITCGLAATPKYVTEAKGKPFLSAQNVRDGKVVYENYKFVSKELFAQITRHNKPSRGDILYTRVGAGIGDAGVIENDFEFAIYVSLTLIKLKYDKADSYFISNLLNSERYKFLAKNGLFAGAGVQNLNVEVVRNFAIPLPPLPEQRAIARALSDADTLIAALDKLLAKKRHIKTATMQQLLTGKKRLPGFGEGKGYKKTDIGLIPEDWDIVKIGKIANIFVGKDVDEAHFSNGQDNKYKYPVYSNTVDNRGLYGYYDYAEFSGDSLTVVGRGVGLGTAFSRSGGFGAIGRLVVVFPAAKCDNRFLTDYINYKIDIFSESSGIPQLTGIGLAKYKVALPVKEEQRAIAQILTDIDTEIAALEKRRAKTQAIKQGMMQELLTGRTRLI